MNFMLSLKNLQEIDTKIYQLERELADLPKGKDAELAKLAKAKRQIEKVTDELNKKRTNLANLELDKVATAESAKKLQSQSENLKSSKQIEAMNSQLAEVASKSASLASLQKSVSASIAENEQYLETAQKDYEEEEQAIKDRIAEFDARIADAQAELKEFQEKREQAATEVLPQHLKIYDRLRKNRRPTVVPLTRREGKNGRYVGAVCGGCNIVQPESLVQLVSHIGLDDQKPNLVTCFSCGRILYLDK